MSTLLPPLPRLPSLKHLPGAGSRKRLPQPVRDTGFFLGLEAPHVLEVWWRLDKEPRDYKLAKRVAKMMGEFPNGTIPELITKDWLDQQQITYTYLAQIAGGHARKGGVEADFFFEYQGEGIVWLVNGDYWHNRPEVKQSDVIDKLTLLAHGYQGHKVDKVAVLWENKIYHNRPQVYEWGLMGIELGE